MSDRPVQHFTPREASFLFMEALEHEGAIFTLEADDFSCDLNGVHNFRNGHTASSCLLGVSALADEIRELLRPGTPRTDGLTRNERANLRIGRARFTALRTI